MAKRVQRLGHTTALADAFTGLARELTIDVTRSEIRLHDGFTAGGISLARADVANVQNATAAQNGRMTIAQVVELTQATIDIAANLVFIDANVADIAQNVVDIASAQASADAAMTPLPAPTAGRLVVSTADGQVLAEDSKLAAEVAQIDAGVTMLFMQAAAPNGWTLNVTQNDRVLRINNAAGGGTGGSWQITGLSSAAIPDHQLTVAEMPAHNHPVSITRGLSGSGGLDSYSSVGGSPVSSGINMSNTGGNTPHGHNAPAIAHTAGWRVAYVDAIACDRNV